MPKRALAEKRPWLLGSLAAAIGFYIYRNGPVPDLFLSTGKGLAIGLLAVYALLRHPSRHAWMLAGVMALCTIGDMVFVLFPRAGIAAFVLAHLLAIVLYAEFRRPMTSPSQKMLALALLLVVPPLGWLLPADRAMAVPMGVYALALAVMAAMAWTSSFPRYRVGTGALLFVASSLLTFGQMGPLATEAWAEWPVWPLYYAGQFLICTGVIQSLRKAGEFEAE